MSFFSDEHAAELRELFFESAEELLQGMNDAGLALENRPADTEELRRVRRAVHTLKGDSAACGFRELSELAHGLEEVLTPEVARESGPAIAEAVLMAADTFHEMLSAYRNALKPPSGSALREHIGQLLFKPEPDSADAADTARHATFAWTEYERLLIADAIAGGKAVFNLALRLEEQAAPAAAIELARKALGSAGKILAFRPENSTARSVPLIEAALETSEREDRVRQRCFVPTIVASIEIHRAEATDSVPARDALDVLLESEAAAVAAGIDGDPNSAQSAATHSRPAETTLRVEAGRIDTVLNLVGELIIGKSMLQRAIIEFHKAHAKDPLHSKFSDALSFQSRVLGELQKSVMKIRMVPVDQLFRRFPRVVRDVARMRNKDIALEIAGQNTDLDKSILDSLADPISHLVRNAADHGIETPAERKAAGKSPQGVIRLDAYHDGDQVVIEIFDDGRGLDHDKIRRRAVERSLLNEDESFRLNEAEILQLIFAPGLSTAEEVTEISGRGVGMDVVKATIDGLKGSIQIKTEAGKGTTFRLLVPLTLASIQALLFRVHDRLYAVPLAAVVEITRIVQDEIHRVDGHEVFRLREQVLTLARLDELDSGSAGERARRVFIVVIDAGTRRFGLAVDSLVGEEELVIKALEDELLTSPLVSGASILGDGRVVLILNVPVVVSRLARIPAVGAIA
ncbi:MAG TPA: chemotaxis protein CheA [Candidatus Aquilonibacter sp.]|nr:chemotaxis protein CheA [Candidatus Aquilonibacter sp.]